MEAFGGCLTDAAVASAPLSQEPPDSEVWVTQSNYECMCGLENWKSNCRIGKSGGNCTYVKYTLSE